jgi:signal transduction histidine kinase
MTIWAPAERPGARKRRSWSLDVAVALVSACVDLPLALTPGSVSTLPGWAGALIVLAMTLPLVFRRVWPVPVFLLITLVAASTGWWAMQIVWAPGLAVAVYTVAAVRPRREALAAAALLLVAVPVAAFHVVPGGWKEAGGLLAATVVVATALGLYIGTRRALLAELRARAAQLERERDQQATLAAVEERARIAREMHDIVAHHLTVMVALADGAAAQAVRAPARAEELMRTVSATGRLALGDTRRLLGVLREDGAGRPDDGRPDDGRADDGRPAELPGLAPLPGLAAVDELVTRVRSAGLAVDYTTEGARPDLAPGLELTVFRIVQEALTNTMKHAGPGTHAGVRIVYGRKEIRVDVEDDGTGSAATPSAGPGRGLAGMRERIEAYGGRVSTGPRSPRGWSVSACLQLDGAGPAS